ncbi:MAG: mechanosensitive ion channel family protein [Anaerosolibacter sp.]|jgi:small conductance mechanosensitive channel|uniref:mechanosensitive ion channel family protein n=1 Tax=Anaerosolibacter sp. TaxID=1872527 RepID=UPI00260B5E98|nr:mechanosensitive ion channel family protein [Anaerosolibacter sp.]MDF2547794.1 mechanosensitive ion channel family protein [Anaerosolibacter sp.]
MDSDFIKSIVFEINIKSFVASLIILVAAFVLIKLIMLFTEKLIQLTNFNEQREKTIKSLIDSVAAYFILTVAILSILSQFGLIKRSTVMTGAGIITLIAGLGAQSFIKDIINGFFILFERQMKVGDFVSINEQFLGTVEEIGLRSTAIREWSLKKVYIPNGEIKTLKNYYKDMARVILEIIIPFEEDHQLVMETLEEICQHINQQHDDKIYKLGTVNYSEFSVYGVMSIDGKYGGAKYIITGVVKPAYQWAVRNRAYEYILTVLKEKNIRLAYPRVYWQQDK